jgi:hypothetical protein
MKSSLVLCEDRKLKSLQKREESVKKDAPVAKVVEI